MRYIISMILVLFINHVSAEEIFPDQCTPIMVSGERVILPAANSVISMIHNLSSTDLWITHPVSESNASSSWSSHLQAGHWSALVSDNKPLELSCIESKPGHEQQISCSAVLALCQWKAKQLPKKATDTPWAAEDMVLSPLIAFIERRGFVLSSSS